MPNCRFCHILDEASDSRTTARPENSVLFEGRESVVMPVLGAFVAPYIMVVTKDHYPSMDAAPPCVSAEASAITRKLIALFAAERGGGLAFEHGACGPGAKAGGCIDHAHIHVVGVPTAALARTLDAADGALSPFGPDSVEYVDVKSSLSADRRYCARGLESQQMRRLAAMALGLPPGHWDWRRHPFPDNVAKTVALAPSMTRILGAQESSS